MNCIYCYCNLVKQNFPKTATSAPVRGIYYCTKCNDISYSFSADKDNEADLQYIGFRLNKNDLKNANINLTNDHAGFYFRLEPKANAIMIHEYLLSEELGLHLPHKFYEGEIPYNFTPSAAPEFLQRLLSLKSFL